MNRLAATTLLPLDLDPLCFYSGAKNVAAADNLCVCAHMYVGCRLPQRHMLAKPEHLGGCSQSVQSGVALDCSGFTCCCSLGYDACCIDELSAACLR